MSVTGPPDAGSCPNCGLQIPQFQPACPNCGAGMMRAPSNAWPPPAAGFLPPLPPEPKLITGNKIVDGILGFLFVFVTLLIGGIGLAVVPITHFATKKTYRAFNMGLNYGAGVAVLLFLGAVVACFVGLKNI